MNLHKYWDLSPEEQEEVKTRLNEQELHTQAWELGMLAHDGTLIRPEDYPCTCKLESPYHCWEEQHEVRAESSADELPICGCVCHTYWQPF